MHPGGLKTVKERSLQENDVTEQSSCRTGGVGPDNNRPSEQEES